MTSTNLYYVQYFDYDYATYCKIGNGNQVNFGQEIGNIEIVCVKRHCLYSHLRRRRKIRRRRRRRWKKRKRKKGKREENEEEVHVAVVVRVDKSVEEEAHHPLTSKAKRPCSFFPTGV